MRGGWVALLAAVLPLSAAAQWTLDAEGARIHDDNPSNAQRRSDIVDDGAWAGRAALGRRLELGEWDAMLRAEARARRYDRYSGLDHLALGLGASGRRKLGLGLTAPWVAAAAEVFSESHDARVRDGGRGSMSASLGKRIDERLELELSAIYDRRVQRHDLPSSQLPGRPFSLQGRSVSLRGSYALTGRALLVARAAGRRGDVVSSTRRNFQIFTESNAIADDPAFGPDYIAYRLSGARTAAYSLGLSWELSRRFSADAFVVRSDTKARGGLDYDGAVYSVSLVYRP